MWFINPIRMASAPFPNSMCCRMPPNLAEVWWFHTLILCVCVYIYIYIHVQYHTMDNGYRLPREVVAIAPASCWSSSMKHNICPSSSMRMLDHKVCPTVYKTMANLRYPDLLAGMRIKHQTTQIIQGLPRICQKLTHQSSCQVSTPIHWTIFHCLVSGDPSKNRWA